MSQILNFHVFRMHQTSVKIKSFLMSVTHAAPRDISSHIDKNEWWKAKRNGIHNLPPAHSLVHWKPQRRLVSWGECLSTSRRPSLPPPHLYRGAIPCREERPADSLQSSNLDRDAILRRQPPKFQWHSGLVKGIKVSQVHTSATINLLLFTGSWRMA